ncbi:hypothetical protein JCM5350_006731 [Sporobolomyces pararoseus]
MPLFVPSDIIHLILDQISKVGDLARCCSTSKTLLSSFPDLRTVDIAPFDNPQIHPPSSTRSTSQHRQRPDVDLVVLGRDGGHARRDPAGVPRHNAARQKLLSGEF